MVLPPQCLSDLTTLVQILCATFAEHCPVYSVYSPGQSATLPFQSRSSSVQPRSPYYPTPPTPFGSSVQPRSPYYPAHPTPYGMCMYVCVYVLCILCVSVCMCSMYITV